MNNYYLSIDLSGTGTTAIFDGFNVCSFISKEWIEHFKFIKKKRSLYRVKNLFILYEVMRPLAKEKNVVTTDLVNYAKLTGALEVSYKNVYGINSFMTKNFKDKLRSNTKNIPGLIFKLGRSGGWFWKEQKINQHEADAIIIYYYASGKMENRIRII